MVDTVNPSGPLSSSNAVAAGEPSGSMSISKETPRSVRLCGSGYRQTGLGSVVGTEMDDEFVTCPVEDFINHYLPFSPSEEETRSCIESLVESETLIDIGGELKWAHYPCCPSQMDGVENKVFGDLQEIADHIASHDTESPRTRNRFSWYLTPNDSIASDIPGFSNKIDGCIAHPEPGQSGDLNKPSLHISGIAVAVELKKLDKPELTVKNNRQVLAASNHIMNDDPRRMHSYGITIVDDQMSMWYFSRSHSSVSESFSFVEDPTTMIKVLMAFFFATEEELGYDPLVSRKTTKDETYYIYNLPDEDGDPAYYRTIRCISEYRSMCITGRMTRIWEVVAITSPVNPEPTGKHMALKDVWLDETAATEKSIQAAIFKDICAFFDNPSWRDDPRLAKFIPDVVEKLGNLVESGDYKRLFLSITRDYQRPTASKPTAPHSSQIRGLFAVKLPVADQSSVQFTSTSKRQPSDPLKPITHDAPEDAGALERRYTPKRQYRLVYNELCTVLHELPTLGELVDVLQETLVALQLLFCAGWVHRDISAGNILAFRTSSNQPWAAKLADLEYAKIFPPTGEPAVDPKTGTPFFMPFEIQNGAQLFAPIVAEDEDWGSNTRRSSLFDHVPAFHNFQHDLESIWWILFWSITQRIESKASYEYGNQIFQNRLRPSVAREKAIRSNIEQNLQIALIPALKDYFPVYMEKARQHIHGAYVRRQARDQVSLPGAYSMIHIAFHHFFDTLQQTRTSWSSVQFKVRKPKPDSKDEPRRLAKRCLSKDDDEYQDENEGQSNRSKRSKTGSGSRQSISRAISPLPSLTEMLTRSRTKGKASVTGRRS